MSKVTKIKSDKTESEPCPKAETWYVTLTSFEDDYKCRSGSWSSAETQYFSTQEKAEDYLCKELLALIYEGHEIDNETRHYYRRDGLVKRQFRQSLQDLEMLVPDQSGEFVSCKFEWDIGRVRCDTQVVKHEQDAPDSCSDYSDTEDDEEEAETAKTKTKKRKADVTK